MFFEWLWKSNNISLILITRKENYIKDLTSFRSCAIMDTTKQKGGSKDEKPEIFKP